MDSSKQAADAITTGFFVVLGAGALVAIQAGLLILILSWLLPTISISFWKALVISIFINLAFK
jgi:hypothetical protein